MRDGVPQGSRLRPVQHSTVAVAAVVALIGWRVVARVRRLVGRQQSRLWRHRASVLVLPFLVGLLFVGAFGQTASLLALAGGSATGAVLALVGFRRTHFEVTADGGFFYTPFGPIGIGLAVLLVGRVGYRAIEILEARGAGSTAANPLELTPATLFVFATLAIYYGVYSLGLLVWRARAGSVGGRDRGPG